MPAADGAAPSCPEAFEPQQRTSPPTSAQVWSRPAAMSVAPEAIDEIVVSLPLVAGVPAEVKKKLK